MLKIAETIGALLIGAAAIYGVCRWFVFSHDLFHARKRKFEAPIRLFNGEEKLK